MNNNTPVEKLLVSRNEAAKVLSLSPRSIDLLIAANRLPSLQVGRRVMVRTSDLQAFAAAETHAERIRPA